MTGEIFTGKTLFGLSIDPSTQDWDFEQSATTYASDPLTTFDFINVPVEMAQLYPDGHKTYQLWKWFKAQVKERVAKHRVGFLDNASALEDSLEAYITAFPTEFNLTPAQLRFAPALKWGAMKSAWSQILTFLSARYECLVIAMHLRTVFDGNKPLKRNGKVVKEPKGKETIMQLASLALWFDRPLIGGVPQRKPNAKVIKDRLSVFRNVNGELTPIPVLPPRIKECTPNVIREYMRNPFGLRDAKEDEKVQPDVLTKEEKLEMETAANIAKAEAINAEKDGKPEKKKTKTKPSAPSVFSQILAMKSKISKEDWERTMNDFGAKKVKEVHPRFRLKLLAKLESLEIPF